MLSICPSTRLADAMIAQPPRLTRATLALSLTLNVSCRAQPTNRRGNLTSIRSRRMLFLDVFPDALAVSRDTVSVGRRTARGVARSRQTSGDVTSVTLNAEVMQF